MRLAILTVGLTLALTGTATAATPMQIANQAWPDGPCHDQPITILWDRAQAAQYGFDGNASGILKQADGSWSVERCEITLDPDVMRDMNPAELCELLVHEAGHLAGVRHTPEGSGVMGPHAGWYAPCHSQRDRIKHDIALRVPDPDPFVVCGRWKRSVMRCQAQWTAGSESWARTAWFRVRRSGETYTIKRVRSPL